MIKDFSQNFVMYHACGAWYHDGTNTILNKNKRCIGPTFKPFSKKANDVRNNVEIRTEVKLKSIVKNDYIKRYFNFINAFDNNKGYFSSEYESIDDESTGDESIKADSYKQNTEQFNTGQKLVIDENTAPNDIIQSETISNTRNPDNNNGKRNEVLPFTDWLENLIIKDCF